MSDSYFVVRQSGVDGPFTEAELLEQITPDRDGETYYGTDLRFQAKLLDHGEFSDNDVIVIRGSIVVPKPKTVVQSYELPRPR